MLHWYPKKDRKRIAIILQLLGYTCALHGIFLLLIFIGYQDQAAAFVFNMSTRDLVDCEVVVMIDPVPLGNKQAPPKKPARTVPCKQVTAPRTALATQKKAPVKKQPVAQKPVAKKTPAPKKEIPKNPAPKKVEPAKKIEQPKPQLVEKKATPPVPQQAATPAMPQQEVDGAQKIVVSYSEARHMYQIQELQQELARHWKPPHGVPEDTACQVTGYVDAHGTITVNIDRSSGILMFDVSARAALLGMQMPEWMRGKRLTVTLS